MTDAIASFNRRAAVATQTGDVIPTEKEEEVRVAPTETIRCVYCKQPRIDDYGIYRTFNWDKRCQLCHNDLVTFAVPATQAVDDVTDHDLYHC